MGDPAKRRATYDDLLAVPKNLVAEIINGTLVTHAATGVAARPGLFHARR